MDYAMRQAGQKEGTWAAVGRAGCIAVWLAGWMAGLSGDGLSRLCMCVCVPPCLYLCVYLYVRVGYMCV